ncbi:hypothetical protein [Alicyclobacillus macrosporangiidus]|uniref:Uncharacterized protein n=1 Tax=Alicyclobacillus macrosporangiidus TaxID=392015 RepID=A0A1I7KBW7_9BACL|nr:hypothetical protein [Alicyclobacillus macrosporangiidus]SFU94944.1 hypothetical protein SAMN05421543_11515 [Alicyclobacillus macrosporangiidus]
MVTLVEQLHAAIAAENAPAGAYSEDAREALQTWEEQGGHLLWIRRGNESVYLVTESDMAVTTTLDATVIEVMPDGETYDKHSSARQVISESAFREMHLGN